MSVPVAPVKLLAVLAALALGACSTVEKLNPFGSSGPKVKPAELAAIQSTAELRSAWQVSIGSAGEFAFSPAVVGDSVYAAARDGAIARFDGGRQVWRIAAGQPISGGVGSDGKLVVVGTPKGEVLAFDAANGRELWKARVSSEVLAAPAVTDGLAIVRSGDSRIFGFDAVDGKRRWVYQRSTPTLSLRSNVGVVTAGKVTLAGFPGGKLVAIANNNGAAVWEVTVALPKGATELERVADVTSSPVVSGSTVCAAAFQGRAACFDSNTGNTLWSREMSSSAGLDIDNRYVYVTDDKGAVHALDRNSGASIWKQDKLALRSLSRPLALGSYVAVADYQGVVHLLRREDGAFAARATTDGSAVRAEPVRFGAGVLVQTANGGLYALEAR
ncbi:MAG: outer membrane protein assembly factor BamB [Sulfuritalea sp.]|nr:outer membrane protein assembly factor BamB [Sulfuritalea sp.]